MFMQPTAVVVSEVLYQVINRRSDSAITVQGAQIAREYERIEFRSRRAILQAPLRACSEAKGNAEEGLALLVPSTLSWPLTGQMIRVSFGSSAAAHTSNAATDQRSV